MAADPSPTPRLRYNARYFSVPFNRLLMLRVLCALEACLLRITKWKFTMTSHCIVSGAANWNLTLFRTDFIRLCWIAAPHSDFDTGQLIDTYNGITSNNNVLGKVNFHSSKIYPKRGPNDISVDGPHCSCWNQNWGLWFKQLKSQVFFHNPQHRSRS